MYEDEQDLFYLDDRILDIENPYWDSIHQIQIRYLNQKIKNKIKYKINIQHKIKKKNDIQKKYKIKNNLNCQYFIVVFILFLALFMVNTQYIS